MESEHVAAISQGVTKATYKQIEEWVVRCWHWITSKKKNPRNKIGLVLALATHNKEEQERLEVDFVKPVKQRISSLSSGKDFNILVLSPEESSKISTSDEALDYLKNVRAHLMIYGDLLVRNNKGDEYYVFRWNGAVRHSPIPFEAGTQFSKEFRASLPEQLCFRCDSEIGSFEITSLHVVYAIRYVIGVAAAFSFDLPLAKNLLEELLNDLEAIPDVDTIQPLAQLRILARRRLSEVLSAYLKLAASQFRHSRKKEDILKMSQELERLEQLDPHNYQAALSRAIYFFFNGEVEKAILELQDINNSDIAWRYSLGFLYAYQGNIDLALQQYQKTLNHPPIPGSFFLDIETFMSDVISKEPAKIQLLFFRGLINFKQKRDDVLAKQDFEKFLVESGGRFPKLEVLASNYLSKMHT